MAAKVELRVFRCLLFCVFALVSAAVAQQPDDNHAKVEGEVPRAGVNGFTTPRCIYCPQPKYSKEALKANFSGVVLLDVTITTDGNIINPIVLKSPGLGLKEKALAQLSKWKMKPALNPEGKPVNCRVQIEISFHRNR
jgi:TonB family protein